MSDTDDKPRIGRPPAKDPKVQRNIYPPSSLWERVTALAETERRRVGEMAVILLERGVDAAERKG